MERYCQFSHRRDGRSVLGRRVSVSRRLERARKSAVYFSASMCTRRSVCNAVRLPSLIRKGGNMGVVPSPLAILLMLWGVVTAVLIVLVIYGNTLDSHEDEEIYINKKEEDLMGGEQKVLVVKMERLK